MKRGWDYVGRSVQAIIQYSKSFHARFATRIGYWVAIIPARYFFEYICVPSEPLLGLKLDT